MVGINSMCTIQVNFIWPYSIKCNVVHCSYMENLHVIRLLHFMHKYFLSVSNRIVLVDNQDFESVCNVFFIIV